MDFPKPTSKYNHEPTSATDPKRPELSVAGKVVLITGGGTGIGIAIVQAFATAGAKHIVISGRRQNLLEETAKKIGSSFPSTKIHVHKADISSVKDVDGLFAATHKYAGPVDILVANAGYLSSPGPISSSDPSDWWQSYEINTKGTYLLGRALASQSPASKFPNPVFISLNTGVAHIGPAFGPMSAYSGSKLAAHTVVDYLQVENPEMKCFSLSPGIIYTDMNVKSGVPKEIANDTVELPAHFSVWLASPESDFLKGKFLWANWDVDDLKALKGKIEADTSVLKVTLGGWPTFTSLA